MTHNEVLYCIRRDESIKYLSILLENEMQNFVTVK